MPETLFTQSATATVLAIGVGSLGSRVAKAGAENAGEAPCAYWSAAHTHPAELIATGLERKLLVEPAEGPFAAQDAERVIAECESVTSALVAGRATAILAVALGENCSEILVPPLAKTLSAKGLFVCVMGCEPFAFEGAAQIERAATAAKLIAAEADLFIRIPARLLSGGLEETAPVTQFLASAERRTLAAIEALAGAFSAGHAASRFSPKTLRPWLRRGTLDVGLGLARGENAPTRAVQEAMDFLHSSSSADINVKSRHLAASVAAAQEISASEAEVISAQLHGILGSADPAAPASTLIAFSTHNHLADEALCLVLLHRGASGKIVSIKNALTKEN